MLDRRRFLTFLGALPLGCARRREPDRDEGEAIPRATATDKPPSSSHDLTVAPRRLLIIIIDDVGVETLSMYGLGGPYATTPRLAQLATEGQLWTNAWGFPTCSPTRAAIQTGKWPFRCGIGVQQEPGMPGLQLSEVCLPEALASVPCGMFGKWHLGLGEDAGGLDAPRAHGYATGVVTRANLNGAPDTYESWTWYRDGVAEPQTGYVPSATIDEALSWIGEQDENWVAVVAMHLAHFPIHCPPPNLAACDASWGNHQRYRAMIGALDRELGRLIDGSPEGVTIILVGDNGSQTKWSVPPVPPGRGKATIWQGGIQVPLICWGPDVTPGLVTAPVSAVDIYATACELFGVEPPPAAVDSVSFVPSLTTPDLERQRTLFAERWDAVGGRVFDRAAMEGPYKLIRWTGGGEQMFEISTDPWEQDDLLPDLEPGQRQTYEVLSALLDGLDEEHVEGPAVG